MRTPPVTAATPAFACDGLNYGSNRESYRFCISLSPLFISGPTNPDGKKEVWGEKFKEAEHWLF